MFVCVCEKIEGGEATVLVESAEVCSKCCSCGAGKERKVILEDDVSKNLKAGDKIEIEIETSSLLGVYALLYLVPLIIFVSSMLTIYAALKNPVVSFFIAISLTATSYVVIGKKTRKKKLFSTNIHKIT